MDNETRIKLLNAGYTKEEIEAGETGTAAGEGNENETRPAPEVKENKKDPEENKEDQPKENNTEDQPKENSTEDPTLTLLKSLTKTVEGLQKTVKVLQDSNIKGATGGAPEKDATEVIMMDFMKKI